MDGPKLKELPESNSSQRDPVEVPQALASNSKLQIDPIAVRDMMEQSAATIVGTNLGEKSALSHYLEALQRPNVTPKDLVIETNKLELAFGRKWGGQERECLDTFGRGEENGGQFILDRSGPPRNFRR